MHYRDRAGIIYGECRSHRERAMMDTEYIPVKYFVKTIFQRGGSLKKQ